MGECKATIKEITFDTICGVKKVRTEILKKSKTVKPDKVDDCVVSEFSEGPCSVPCDEKLIGGMADLTREIIQKNNEHGIKCPTLTFKKKCNQMKCPVDCKMSEWSAWSKCTKECEGGSQSKTRSILTEPKNGGNACEGVSSSQSCNTGSCDRNCGLHKWTEYTKCSQICDKGYKERFRKIRVPQRGAGKCPKKASGERYAKQQCNKQGCLGDEQCVSTADIILAFDGSGSLKETGFNTLKKFGSELLERLQTKAYKKEAMKIGVLQFGNGELLGTGEDRTVSKAKAITPLTFDKVAVKKGIDSMTWQKGFTNMAQAFTRAEAMLSTGGRKQSPSTVMIITDGVPSFKFSTGQSAQVLRDKGIKVVIVSVKEFPNKKTEGALKSWVSAPWQSNYIKVPGLKALSADFGTYVTKTIVQACRK